MKKAIPYEIEISLPIQVRPVHGVAYNGKWEAVLLGPAPHDNILMKSTGDTPGEVAKDLIDNLSVHYFTEARDG